MERIKTTAQELEKLFRASAPNLKDAEFEVHRYSGPGGWVASAFPNDPDAAAINLRLHQVWKLIVGLYEVKK